MADYEPTAPYWYTSALERLVAVVRELSQARDIDSIAAIVREAARDLTGADGATLILRDGDTCYYADENAIAPLWKGQRFPVTACISGWVMHNAQPVIIEDIYADPRIPAAVYRPTFVRSMAMVPIRRNAPVGAIGNYWSNPYLPTTHEIAILQALADTASIALENAELYARLQEHMRVLQVQQDRIQAQHSSLDVFTRALAHDLKEPVRTLVSYSGLLREEPQAQGNATYLSYIRNAAGRMEMLIDAVSRYTWLDDPNQPKRTLCDLDDIIDAIRKSLATQLAGRGTRLIAKSLPKLNADPAHLQLLLQNLIANAILHNEHPVTVTVRHAIRNGHPEFSVSDDGAGFDPAQAEQIFLPFQRLTHLEGCAGLGLAICRRIVALYGGEIRCESALGQGAAFIFTLPDTAELDPAFARHD